MKRRAAALLLPLALAACGGGGPTLRRAQLPRLVLQPADVPGLRRFEVGEIEFADTTPGPREELDRFGRLGGWKARYEAVRAPARGPRLAYSFVDLFRNVGGAKDDLHAYKLQFDGEIVDSDGAEQYVDVPKLGAGSYATTTVAGRVRDYRVAWRFENVTASVFVEGLDGRISLADALALARKQQRRLVAAAPKM